MAPDIKIPISPSLVSLLQVAAVAFTSYATVTATMKTEIEFLRETVSRLEKTLDRHVEKHASGEWIQRYRYNMKE